VTSPAVEVARGSNWIQSFEDVMGYGRQVSFALNASEPEPTQPLDSKTVESGKHAFDHGLSSVQ